MERLLNRDEALAHRPSRISEAALARCAWVRTEDGFDETSIQLFNISQTDAGYLFQREVWWFEEDAMRWTLDESQEWWMPPTEARALIDSLHAVIAPR